MDYVCWLRSDLYAASECGHRSAYLGHSRRAGSQNLTGLLQISLPLILVVLPFSANMRRHQISWAIELLYCIITWLAKAALIFQLQRTFSPSRTGAVFIVCQVLLWSNLAFYFSSFMALVVECVPQQRIWDPLITTGHCIKTGDLLIAMGVINVVSDLLILIMPIWAILHLRISTKLKIGVSAIFGTGLLAFACSICRLAYTIPPLHSEDATYLFAPVGMWS
jgi:hypothetical protein